MTSRSGCKNPANTTSTPKISRSSSGRTSSRIAWRILWTAKTESCALCANFSPTTIATYRASSGYCFSRPPTANSEKQSIVANSFPSPPREGFTFLSLSIILTTEDTPRENHGAFDKMHLRAKRGRGWVPCFHYESPYVERRHNTGQSHYSRLL